MAVFGEVGNEFGLGTFFLRFEAGVFFILEVEREFENKRAYRDVNFDIFSRGALPVGAAALVAARSFDLLSALEVEQRTDVRIGDQNDVAPPSPVAFQRSSDEELAKDVADLGLLVARLFGINTSNLKGAKKNKRVPAALVEEALLGQVSAAAFARDDFWTAEKPSQSISAGLRTSFARTLSRTASTMGGDTRAEPIGGTWSSRA